MDYTVSQVSGKGTEFYKIVSKLAGTPPEQVINSALKGNIKKLQKWQNESRHIKGRFENARVLFDLKDNWIMIEGMNGARANIDGNTGTIHLKYLDTETIAKIVDEVRLARKKHPGIEAFLSDNSMTVKLQ